MSGDHDPNLYSEKQQAFVNRIPDERLRDQLLHTVMLSDRMTADRDRCLTALERVESEFQAFRNKIREIVK